ncbi:MAG: ESX secretion-associated protein EspG [Saccharopolyspora rectivirgula]
MRCSLSAFSGLLTGRAPEVAEFLLDERNSSGEPEHQAISAECEDFWSGVAAQLASASVYGFARFDGAGTAELSAVVAIGAGRAVRVQAVDGVVTAEKIRHDAPWPALAGCLPPKRPAEGDAVTVPLDSVRQFATRPGTGGEGVGRAAQLLSRADDFTARLYTGLRRADGQLRTADQHIEVHHAPTGRVAVIPQPADHCLVSPADLFVLASALQEQVEALWAADVERTQPISAPGS